MVAIPALGEGLLRQWRRATLCKTRIFWGRGEGGGGELRPRTRRRCRPGYQRDRDYGEAVTSDQCDRRCRCAQSPEFWAAGKPIPGNPFNVVSYNPTLNTVTLNKPVGFALSAGRDYVVVEPRPAAPATTLAFTAKALGDWGNGISVRVAPMIGGTFNILADPAIGGAPFTTQLSADGAAGASRIAVADASGFTTGDHARISGQEYTLAIASNTTTSAAAAAAAATIALTDPSGFTTGDQVLISGTAYTLTVVSTRVTAAAAVGRPDHHPGQSGGLSQWRCRAHSGTELHTGERQRRGGNSRCRAASRGAVLAGTPVVRSTAAWFPR